MRVRARKEECKKCIFNKDGYCRIATNGITIIDIVKGEKYKECKFNR